MMAFMVMVVSMMAAGNAIAADVNAVFMAGAAKADITPEVFPLTRAPKVTITGVLDSLTVRVIALSKGPTTVLLIASETGRSFGPVFAKAIARHTALPLENIILTSTHTHAAPEITEHDSVLIAGMLRGKKAPKDLTPDKANLLIWARKSYDKTLAAVDAALRSRRPAAVGIGYTESYINVNRNSLYVDTRDIGWNPAGDTDHTLAVVNIVDSNGNSIACIMHYAVHGTVMHANTCMPDGGTAVSADIPGIVSGYMETRILSYRIICMLPHRRLGNLTKPSTTTQIFFISSLRFISLMRSVPWSRWVSTDRILIWPSAILLIPSRLRGQVL